MTKKLFSAPFIAFLICGTLIPACVIAYYGFTDRSGAFTWANVAAMATGQHMKALGLSLLLAFVSTVICLLLAFPLGMILKGTQAWEERLHDLCVYSADVDEFFAPHNGMAGPA